MLIVYVIKLLLLHQSRVLHTPGQYSPVTQMPDCTGNWNLQQVTHHQAAAALYNLSVKFTIKSYMCTVDQMTFHRFIYRNRSIILLRQCE